MQTSKIITRSYRRLLGATTITLVMASVMITLVTAIACERAANSHEIKQGKPAAETPPTYAGRTDEINIELTGNGFLPTEATHPAGAFGISVENSSNANDYTLRLKAQDGTILNEIPVQKGSVAWSVSLQPGQYRLTEANHEHWTCVITVQ